MPTDPVCGMVVRPGPDALTAEVRDTTYYFCAASCRFEFLEPERQARQLRVHTVWAFATGLLLMVAMARPPTAPALLNWIALAGAAPVQFIAGRRFYQGFWHSVKARSANMDTLIAIGTTVAFGYSILVTLLPARYGTETFYDTAVLILAFILLGRTIEHAMKTRATGAIRALLKLQPNAAWVRVGAQVIQRPAAQLRIGDVFRVRPGESIATDGVIVEGRADIDEKMVTGESLPVARNVGEAVIGGTVNVDGVLWIEARRIGADTALSRIVRLVENAQAGTAPVQRIADRVAAVFVPVVVAVAAATFAGWWILGPGGFEPAMLNGIAVLIVACPCAIGLATPAALLVGTSKGARRGILLQSGAALEALHGVDSVLFDKTGTLTRGRPVVVEVGIVPGAEPLVALLGIAEAGSEHPLAKAIAAHLEAPDGRGRMREFSATAGRGVQAIVDGHKVTVGGQAWLEEHQVDTRPLEHVAQPMSGAAMTLAWGAVDGAVVAVFGLRDETKATARAAVALLQSAGIDVVMVTGDSSATANAVAATLGIWEVLAEVPPEQKDAVVVRQQQAGRKVAFVGDGINDAPALAAADVGIALGSGTDVAVEAADVVLVHSDPADVHAAFGLGRRTLTKIHQNLFWAFAYNVALIPLAAAGLLAPIWAAAAMGLSSISVVGNSLLLNRYQIAPVAAAEPRLAGAVRATHDIDIVCGMRVRPAAPDAIAHVHAGQRYVFCRIECRDRFAARPDSFLNRPVTPAPNATLMT